MLPCQSYHACRGCRDVAMSALHARGCEGRPIRATLRARATLTLLHSGDGATSQNQLPWATSHRGGPGSSPGSTARPAAASGRSSNGRAPRGRPAWSSRLQPAQPWLPCARQELRQRGRHLANRKKMSPLTAPSTVALRVGQRPGLDTRRVLGQGGGHGPHLQGGARTGVRRQGSSRVPRASGVAPTVQSDPC